MPRSRAYRNGVVVAEDFPVADLSEYIADPGVTAWVDINEPSGNDLAQIAEELGLHRLAVEDAVHAYERPKLDRYETHKFLTAYTVELNTNTGTLVTHKISAFATKNALVTVQEEHNGFDIDALVARWDEGRDLAKHGVAFLLYELLDLIVDTHFEAVQSLDQEMEALEDHLFDDRPRDKEMQRRTFELRKSLVLLRRVVLPMREVVNGLMRHDGQDLDPGMAPYFQDVYDHVLRATEWTESLRDLVTTILETHLTLRSNRLNIIMKQVTSWAAIIAVPTAVTGYYGMNVPYPGYQERWGFIVSTVVILAASGGLYWAFKRRGWL